MSVNGHSLVTNSHVAQDSTRNGIESKKSARPSNDVDGCSYEVLKGIADYILDSSKHRPKIGIICGSGLGGIADKLVKSEVYPYDTIPNLPVTSVIGHAGRLVLGELSGVSVMCMQGRVHYYEGHPMWKCTMNVRVMKLMGIEDLIVTNAAGGLNAKYKLGDLMILKDHLNLLNFGGVTPLRGINDPRFGPQFPSMNNAYDRNLRQEARRIVAEAGMADMVREGVYAMVTGPMYETPTELKALLTLGVDAVGMSTVPEVIIARHCGIRVFSFSLITNICVTDVDAEADTHADVVNVGISRKDQLHHLVGEMVVEMSKAHAAV